MSFSTTPEGNYEYVHLFAQNSSELNQFAPTALSAIIPDGLLWISYPKKSSKMPTALTRDQGWTVITQAGHRPVRQVSIDSTWSAVRFRLQEIKKEEDIVDAWWKRRASAAAP